MLVEKILPNLLAHCLNYFCKWDFGDVSAVPSPPQHSDVGVRARINFMHTFQSACKMLEASSGIVGETMTADPPDFCTAKYICVIVITAT